MGKLFFDGNPPQPDRKFKVGDRVRLIENKTALRFEGVRRHVGKIFTVEKKNFLGREFRPFSYEYRKNYDYIFFVDPTSHSFYVCDEDLELVTEGAANG